MSATDYDTDSSDEIDNVVNETPLPDIDPAFRVAVLEFKNGLYRTMVFHGDNDSSTSQSTDVLGRFVGLLHTIFRVLNDLGTVEQLPSTIRDEVNALKTSYKANMGSLPGRYRQYLENNFITYPYVMNDTFPVERKFAD